MEDHGKILRGPWEIGGTRGRDLRSGRDTGKSRGDTWGAERNTGISGRKIKSTLEDRWKSGLKDPEKKGGSFVI
jgi:hypothetical protein